MLPGDVELGQIAELLLHAARPGEEVTVGILGEAQTAIVEAGAQVLINFNHFFREASGLLPAGSVTVTISRQPLDQTSGEPLPGSEEVLLPSDGRVTVSAGGVHQQHFVDITDAVLGDSAVYTAEVCSLSGTPDETCRSASVTLFVLDREFILVAPLCWPSA